MVLILSGKTEKDLVELVTEKTDVVRYLSH